MGDFELPFKAIFTCGQDQATGEYVAHALDFDLICTGATPEESLEKLRQCTKAYIEFGYSQGWKKYIDFPAPEECWERALTDEKPMTPLPPIIIDKTKFLVFAVRENEACAAA